MSQLGKEYLTGNNIHRDHQKAYELLHKLEEIGGDAEEECKGKKKFF